MADESRVVRVFSLVGVSAVSAAGTATKIATTDNAVVKSFYPEEAFAVCTGLTGTLISLCAISIGTNGPNYDNIVPSTLLIGLSAISLMNALRPSGAIAVVAPGSDIFVNIRTPAAGTGLTMTLDIFLNGFYK